MYIKVYDLVVSSSKGEGCGPLHPPQGSNTISSHFGGRTFNAQARYREGAKGELTLGLPFQIAHFDAQAQKLA